MSWTRPTLQQVQKRIAADISGNLLDGAPLLSRSVLAVVANVWAGACHLMYGFFAWAFKQVFIDTCEAEFLDRFARIWAVRRKAGGYAAGTVIAEGAAGSIIPAGTLWRDAQGLLYSSSADASLGENSTCLVSITATATGAAYNLEAGSLLHLVSPVAGVQMQGTAQSVSGGTNTEDDASLRARLLAKVQAPPHGGNAADYVQWALSVDGVTRAWCLPLYYGIGTVGLTFVCDASENIIPTPQMVARVQAYIDSVKPVTASVLVFQPQKMPVDIAAIITPNNEAVRQRAQRELQDLFLREGAPGQSIPLSHLDEALSITPGETDHSITAPTADIVPSAAQIPVLGTITFTGVQ